MKTLLLAVFVSVSLLAAINAEIPLPDPGPENQGLRLRLTIREMVDGQVDNRVLRVDLLNVGQKPVVLVTGSDLLEEKLSYPQFFQRIVGIATSPEAPWSCCQTMFRKPKEPPPKWELEPGRSLTVAWAGEGRRLKQDGCVVQADLQQQGLYRVHASVCVMTEDGDRISLTSNEQEVYAGGSHEMPKSMIGHIIKTDPEQSTAMIDIGSDEKIEVGDCFTIRYELIASWSLCITHVTSHTAEGIVECVHKSPRDPSPAFPQEKWRAQYSGPKPPPSVVDRE